MGVLSCYSVVLLKYSGKRHVGGERWNSSACPVYPVSDDDGGIWNLWFGKTEALSEMKKARKYGELKTTSSRYIGRAGKCEEEREDDRALAAVSLLSWESSLELDGFQTSKGVSEMNSLLTYKMLPNLSLGISKMRKE